ncbi:hypothetical protein GCM10022409_44210 [Hymenobacter glaciei]|uniref:SMI1/KNR4 family protein n=1 Tax=Hymenobacter glaciei TaxID=877209 RepID=A0ABP7UTH8_9BACT
MILENIYRLDYPIYDPEAASGAWPISADPDASVESQPLGLLLQFSSLATGLFVYITNDSEQICYEVVNVADMLAYVPNYFGYISLVSEQSDMQKLVGSELQQIHMGFADGHPLDHKLLFGIKLEFDASALIFLNNCDEGCYLFEGSEKHVDFFTHYSKVFTEIKWQEQHQLLEQIAA